MAFSFDWLITLEGEHASPTLRRKIVSQGPCVKRTLMIIHLTRTATVSGIRPSIGGSLLVSLTLSKV